MPVWIRMTMMVFCNSLTPEPHTCCAATDNNVYYEGKACRSRSEFPIGKPLVT